MTEENQEKKEYHLPENLRYAKDHEWARLDGDKVVVGLDDYAQYQLGDIVYVEMPELGAAFSKGDVFATVESVKAVSECYMPVGGEVIAVNSALEEEPELVNNDCYGAGWFVEIKPNDASEMDSLMDSNACRQSVTGE